MTLPSAPNPTNPARRDWLLGAGAALLLAPAWVRRAFAADGTCPPAPRRLNALQVAVQNARAAHRPLLVLTAPTDGVQSWIRGAAFGEWLNHGGDPALADLSEADLVCATTADLAKVLKVSSAEPVMRLVWNDTVVDLAGEIAAGETDEIVNTRIAILTGTVRGALLQGRADRALAARARLSVSDQQRLTGSAKQFDDAFLRAAAPVLLEERGKEAEVLAALAGSARARLVKPPISGSLWAQNTGCGTQVEDPDHPGEILPAPCGMGHVGPKSRRFVRFYTGCT